MVFFYYTIFEIEWLGWDIMEPITYSLDLVGLAIAMRFYLKFGRNRGAKSILEHAKEQWLRRNGVVGFRYRKLNEARDNSVKDMKYVNESIEYYKARNMII
jgi:hypothetical protein